MHCCDEFADALIRDIIRPEADYHPPPRKFQPAHYVQGSQPWLVRRVEAVPAETPREGWRLQSYSSDGEGDTTSETAPIKFCPFCAADLASTDTDCPHPKDGINLHQCPYDNEFGPTDASPKLCRCCESCTRKCVESI